MQVVKVSLSDAEYAGLVQICKVNLRSVDAQLRHMLREDLTQRGPITNKEELPSDESKRQPMRLRK
jgi:hypothetical protein